MYGVSQTYHSRIVSSDHPQELIMTLGNKVFSSAHGDFELVPQVMTDNYNADTDIMMGGTSANTFECSLVNINGALDDMDFSAYEARPYIAVQVGTGTWTPSSPLGDTIVAAYFYGGSPLTQGQVEATTDGVWAHLEVPGYVSSYVVERDTPRILFCMDNTFLTADDEKMYTVAYEDNGFVDIGNEPVDAFWQNKPNMAWTISGNTLLKFHEDHTYEEWELCPLGVFTFETPTKRKTSVIHLVGYDRMVKFDRDASDFISQKVSGLSLQLRDYLGLLCDYVGVPYTTTGMANYAMNVTAIPTFNPSITCRNILSYIAEAGGGNARFDRDGVLEIVWYGSSPTATITDTNVPYGGYEEAEYTVPQISKLVTKLADGKVYTNGTGDVQYTVLGNSFLSVGNRTALANVFSRLQTIADYAPIISQVISADPSVESRDMVIILGHTVPLMRHTISWCMTTSAQYISTGNAQRELPSSLDRTDFAVAYNRSAAEKDREALVAFQNDMLSLTALVTNTISTADAAQLAAQQAQDIFNNYANDPENVAAMDTAKNINGYIKVGVVGFDGADPISGIAIGERITTTTEQGEEVIVKDNMHVITASDSTIYVGGVPAAVFAADVTKIPGDFQMAGKWRFVVDADGVLELKYIG